MAPKLAHKRSLFVSRPRRTIGAAGRLHGKGRCGMASPGARVAGAADGGDGGLPSWVARHGDGGVVRGGAHAPAPPRRLGVPEVRQPQARPGGGQAEEAPVHAPRAAALRDLRDPDAGVAAAAAEVVPGVPARRRLEGGRLRGRSRARPGDERGHRALRGARAPRRDVGRIGAPSAGSRARSRSATSSWAPPRGRWAGGHQAGAGLRRVARRPLGPTRARGSGGASASRRCCGRPGRGMACSACSTGRSGTRRGEPVMRELGGHVWEIQSCGVPAMLRGTAFTSPVTKIRLNEHGFPVDDDGEAVLPEQQALAGAQALRKAPLPRAEAHKRLAYDRKWRGLPHR
jgi:hypothetical protein